MRSEIGKMYDEILIQLATDPMIKKVDHTQISKTMCEVIAKTLDVEQVSLYKMDFKQLDLVPITIYHAPTRKLLDSPKINILTIPDFYNTLKTNRYLNIFHLNEDPLSTQLMGKGWDLEEVKSVLFVPIRGGGRLIGVLKIDQKRSRRIWIEDEINFACQVADIAAMNFLYGDTLYSQNASETILEYVHDLQETEQVADLSDRFVNYMATAIQADSVLLFKVDSNLSRLWVTDTYQAPPGYEKLSLSFREGIAGMTAEQAKTILITDYAGYPKRELIFDLNKPFNIVISKPIFHDGQVVAVIQAMRDGKKPIFGIFEECVMDQMIAWFGVFIDRRKLHQKIQILKDYQRTLNRIFEAGYFTSSFPDLINTILDYCMPILKARMAIVVLEKHTLNRGLSPDFEQKLNLLLNENPSWRSSVLSIHSEELAREMHPLLVELIKFTEIQSFMLVPILLDGQRVGFIFIASPYYSDWSQDEISLMEMTSKHLALEYYRVQSRLKNKNQSGLVHRMNNMGHKLSHTLTYDEAIKVVGNTAMDMLNPDHAFLLLQQPQGELKNIFSYRVPSWAIQQILEDEKQAFEKKFLNFQNPVLINVDSALSLPEKLNGYIQNEQIKSIKILPFLYQNQVVGIFAAMYKNFQSWPEYERDVMSVFARTGVLTLQNAWMYDELEKGYLDLALALANAMDERETTVSDSTLKIANCAEKTARYLGCPEDEIRDIRWAALLHDIGKLEVPEQVLRKPGPLSEEEWVLLKQAPNEAEKIIKPLLRYRTVGMILNSYHEHFDGNGYPNQLKGRQIPLGARILALADAFVSMIDHRTYRGAMQPEEAILVIKEKSGKQFDPVIVGAFINTLEEAVISN